MFSALASSTPHVSTARATQWLTLAPRCKQTDRGLETGSRDVVTHVVRQNDIVVALSSPLNPTDNEIGRRLAIKGDAIKASCSVLCGSQNASAGHCVRCC